MTSQRRRNNVNMTCVYWAVTTFDIVPSIGLEDMGLIKGKNAFDLAQNAQIQIILHKRKVSSESLLSIHIFCSDALADLDLCCPHMPEDKFSHNADQ